MSKTKADNQETKRRKAKAAHGVQAGSATANRLAIAILEVLVGERTPTDAASALGITVPRYYQLETRALNGLVSACEPRPKGKQPSPKTRIAQLERELAQTQREAARQQSLVRAAHRSLGLKAAPPSQGRAASPGKKGAGSSQSRRPRRPVARGLKAVKVLRQSAGSTGVETEAAAVAADLATGPDPR